MRRFMNVEQATSCDGPDCGVTVEPSPTDGSYSRQTVVSNDEAGCTVIGIYCSNRCVNADAPRLEMLWEAQREAVCVVTSHHVQEFELDGETVRKCTRCGVDVPAPAQTPAEQVGIDGVKVKAVVGKYNAIRLTGPQVNALAEAAGLSGDWPAPRQSTRLRLAELGLTVDRRITSTGRAWLRAEGLLPAEPTVEPATTTPVGTRVRTADTGACGRVVKIVPTGNPAGMFRHSYVIELDGGQRISRMPDRFSRVDEPAEASMFGVVGSAVVDVLGDDSTVVKVVDESSAGAR